MTVVVSKDGPLGPVGAVVEMQPEEAAKAMARGEVRRATLAELRAGVVIIGPVAHK